MSPSINRVARILVDRLTEAYDAKELAAGTKEEMEHTDDPKEAEKIAKDHLREDPKYYSKLKKAGLVDK